MRIFRSLKSAVTDNIKLWDPLTKQKIHLSPQREKVITWYSCGPTVYDSAHIGHASSYIRLDMIRRILERQNYKVLQIMGITDIDDKIIHRAHQLQVPWENVSRQYESEFVEELGQLNIKSPNLRARVSNYIPQIIVFVEKLVESGFAYPVSDGSVYFDTSKYGKKGIFVSVSDEQSSRDPEETAESKLKRSRADFALWKGWKPNEPFWVTKWGKGRPGWHIECSAMATHYFGPSLDMHSGGCDLIFPHHQNEEAQSCAHFGVDQWVKHWIHTGHLILKDDVKMSKSLGNTLTISEFLQENSADSLRMFCLVGDIRSHLNFSSETFESAKNKLKRVESFISDCTAILQGVKSVRMEPGACQSLWSLLASTENNINALLCDDFSISAATNALMEFMKEFNRALVPLNQPYIESNIDFSLVMASLNYVQEFLHSLGFTLGSARVSKDSSQGDEDILEEFLNFRQSVRAFALALDTEDKVKRRALIQERKDLVQVCDQVRERLASLGIEIKDHGKASSWSLKQT